MRGLTALGAGAGLLAVLTVASCGVSSATSSRTAPSPKPAGHDLARAPAGLPKVAADLACSTSSGPPTPTQLTSPVDYPTIQVQLSVPPAAVQPRISAAAAFARVAQWNHPGAGQCTPTETLAYWSSSTPATIPDDCVPQATSGKPWVAPSDCASTPMYPHVLAWVFTWRSDCHSSGGPTSPQGMSPRPAPSWPPLACSAITFIDATTGASADYWEFGTV